MPSAKRRIRVLLVDDSPSVRAVLRRFLRRSPEMEVVGEASDGAEAVELFRERDPHVVLMDLQMPVMDGYAAIEKITSIRPTPIVVLTSRANRNQMETAFEALSRGAAEVLPKPEDADSWRLLAEGLAASLAEVVQAWSERGSPPRPPARRQRSAPSHRSAVSERAEAPPVAPPSTLRWVGVGASTGGPAAVRELLVALPVNLPVSVLVVQHIAPGFEVGLVDWLGKELPWDVRLARDGERPRPGQVRLAPAGFHLRLTQGGVLHLDASTPPRGGHRPAVDELLLSIAETAPRESAGVLLTGMGSDGVEGLLALGRAGGMTLVQDAESCVVFGMPRSALERGAAEVALPPAGLGAALAAPPRPASKGGKGRKGGSAGDPGEGGRRRSP